MSSSIYALDDMDPMKRERPGALSMPAARNVLYHAYLLRIFQPTECDAIIQAAEQQAAMTGWTVKRHKNFPTCDQPLDRVVSVAGDVRARIWDCVLARVPQLYGFAASRIVERDLFIVKYDATTAGGQRELEIHRDGSLLTFNILLSDPGTFSGGGTMLEPLDAVVRPSQGACIVHSGHWRHAGHPITAGKRYILVGFIDARDARIRPFPSVLELHRSLRGAAGSFTDRWVLDHVFDRAAPPRWLCSTPSPSSVPLEVKGEHARPGGVFSRQSHSGRQTTHPALSEVLPQIEALVADQREAAQQKWHHSRGVASSFRGGAAAQRMGSRYQPRPARPGERRPGPLPPMTGPSKSRGSRNTTAAADSTDSAAAAARASARAQAWARASASWAAMRLDPFSKGVRSERNTVQHARRGPGNSASPARAWNAPRREPKRRSLADIIHPHRGSLTSVVRAGGSGRYSAACAR